MPDFSIEIGSLENPSCSGSGNGSITITVTPASPSTYPYQFYVNGTPVRDTENSPTSFTLNNFSAGSYEIYATDSLGNPCDPIYPLFADPDPVSFDIVSQTNVACNGDSSGAVEIIGTGGTGIYSYSFDFGAFGFKSSWNSLPAGTYEVQVIDTNGCLGRGTVTITEPAAIQCTLTSPTVNIGGVNYNISVPEIGRAHV